MSSDLEKRVENRKRELISEILEHKKNSSRFGAADEVEKIKSRLAELTHILKDALTDGWANLAPGAKTRLDAWIAR